MTLIKEIIFEKLKKNIGKINSVHFTGICEPCAQHMGTEILCPECGEMSDQSTIRANLALGQLCNQTRKVNDRNMNFVKLMLH
jgi:hypothetical protein